MPKVTFIPNGTTAEFELGRLPYHGHGKPGSLLDIALNVDVPIEHACGGNCACTTCHVVVLEGEGNLSPMEDDEADRLEMAAGVTLHSRLACQAVVRGDVKVEIPEWNRNYASEAVASTSMKTH
ncbi:MAG: 2Fe-2S iron-sulfur cluster-binding protein [Bryobacteraceae bacterium]